MQAYRLDADFLHQIVPAAELEEDNWRNNLNNDSEDDVESDIKTNGGDYGNLEHSPFTQIRDSTTESALFRRSVELGRITEPSTPTPYCNRQAKNKELPVITIPVTGRLRKRIRKNYHK